MPIPISAPTPAGVSLIRDDRGVHPKLTLHDLRHVFAVTAARADVPLGELQMILCHKTPAMTLRYSRHCPTNTPELARDRLASYLGGA